MRSLLGKIDRTNALIAALVWIAVLVLYTRTLQPTVSFWDCGEFITCSYILGIPHPPGTPLYILIGRLFSVIPFFADISARVNFLSALCSSIAAMFAYLVGVRLLRDVLGNGGKLSLFITYAGSAAGALLFAFGVTQWNNSIEAEVYGTSIMLIMMVVWLVLIYRVVRSQSAADRIMIAAIYLLFLGIGVHMTTFLAFPVLALVFILKRNTPARSWYVLGAFFFFELYLVFAMSSQPGEIPYYLPVLIGLIMYLFYVFSLDQFPRVLLFMAGGLVLSLLPLFNVFVALAQGSDSLKSAAAAVPTSVEIVGAVIFAGVVVYAVLLLIRTLKAGGKRDSGTTAVLTATMFVIATAVMTIIPVLGIRGYYPFLLVSIVLTAVTGIMLRNDLRWSILVGVLGAAMIILGIYQFVFGLIIAGALLLLMGPVFRVPDWKPALMILVVALIGFSVHVYLPVRSAQDPVINENNPAESLDATVNFLERKQYGSESMVPRMFTRRAEWANQFGMHNRMGFWGFFNIQWHLEGSRFLLLFILGLFGLWELARQVPRAGVVMVLLTLVGSVGLILYMNFADGTRMVGAIDYLEVRDRDYFFTPAFVLFGLAIGLGAAFLVQYVRNIVAEFNAPLRGVLVGAASVLFLIPVYAIAGNHFECDRSRNYIPYNYAWNQLATADPDAVLFVGGDNDTFPLWCLQTVYGIRPDVLLVNLSLSNLDWYVKQIRDKMGLKLGWTDEEIKKLRPFRLPDGRVFKVQDQVVDAIIFNNYEKRPINFAVTVGSGNRKIRGERVDSLFTMSGLKFRLDPRPRARMTVQVEETIDFFTDPEKFRLDGIADPSIHKDETTLRVTANYASGFLVLADTLRVAGELERAEEIVRYGMERIPHAPDLLNSLVGILAQEGKYDEMRRTIQEVSGGDKQWLNVMLAMGLIKEGRTEEGEALLVKLLDNDPTYRRAFEELVRYYANNRQYVKVAMLLERWLINNPTDSNAREMLTRLRSDVLGSDGKDTAVDADTGS